ncbi:hypothetical protein N7457_001759 [Penicillium paradoxum]|uniref:uncharacterized protein n=1 Tax=Penicillium paradoxum TaxID=176176 RepID=UPI0025487942|nr:uncharacterized protein N7457_001759 [Penicillium paradoxum]KAJ5795160.1 hypothetical protein N7457_001759 [Penicillium paradoxum]
MDATESPGPDTIDIISTAGTWLAVFLALVALVGILGPWLAIRAAFSDKNRALNAVYDMHGDYVTRGIVISGNLRLFRQTKIPDLAPKFNTNTPEIPKLISEDNAGRLLEFRQPHYNSWNTGWSKLCALIQAQQVVETENHEPTTNHPTETNINIDEQARGPGWSWRRILRREEADGDIEDANGEENALQNNPRTVPSAEPVPQPNSDKLGVVPETFKDMSSLGGTLDIVESRTAVAASRYWILLLGLLGKYSSPAHRGAASRLILGDFPGERLSNYAASQGDDTASEVTETDNQSWETHVSRGPYQGTRGPSHGERYRAYLSSHGTWELSSAPARSIEGYTGSFRDLGRHRGSFVNQSTVTFSPKTVSESRERGSSRLKKQVSSIVVQFWLAHGFLPSNTKSGQPDEVISLQDPVQDGMNPGLNELFTGEGKDQRTKSYLSLAETANVPLSIKKSSIALGVPSCTTKQWIAHDEPTLTTFDEWTQVKIKEKTMNVLRSDLFVIINRLLMITWDDWGYLIWKSKSESNIWTNVLEPVASDTFKNGRLIRPFLWEHCTEGEINTTTEGHRIIPDHSALDWRVNAKFYAPKTADYVQFEVAVETWINNKEAKLPIAFLFINDQSFRKSILEMLSHTPIPTLARDQPSDQEPDPSDPVRDQTTQLNPTAAWVEDVAQASSASEGGRASSQSADWSCRRSSSIEGPEFEEDDPRLTLAGPQTEEDRQPAEQPPQPLYHLGRGVTKFKYCRTRNLIKWKSVAANGTEADKQASLPSESSLDINNQPSGDPSGGAGDDGHEVDISDTDVIFIALWAATRCAIWMSSEDSIPLIKFVNNLDRYVWVI